MAAEQFLRSLQSTLEQAIEVRDSLACCIKMGLITDRPDIEAYIQDLETYINANRRISMQCANAYSPGPQQIAVNNHLSEN